MSKGKCTRNGKRIDKKKIVNKGRRKDAAKRVKRQILQADSDSDQSTLTFGSEEPEGAEEQLPYIDDGKPNEED